MSFLKAEWRKLVMVNYEVNPDVLMPHLPFGTELDYYDDKCYVSLVGFMFMNTKLLGVKVPFHINFEEVNLRFYVKRKTKRGVVFIKEIVPKPALTFIANTVYKENYVTLPMSHRWEENSNEIKVAYSWKENKKKNFMQVDAVTKPIDIEEGSVTEFIAEHYWGYSKVNEQKTTEYEVIHPKWKHYPINSYHVDVDFGSNYGTAFDFLNNNTPSSIMLLEGSEVSVENKRIIK
ncbi:MAG: DUF2071 domain-containing protein [Flavobacteriaceae bacterium]